MKLALLADRVIMCNPAELIENGVVLIDGNRIAGVGPAATTAVPEDYRSVSFPGCTLLPGLIDMHVHLCLDADPIKGWDHPDESPAYTMAMMVSAARQQLNAGVTTVRDQASRGGLAIDLRDAIEEGLIIGPRIAACGYAITKTGGHLHFMAREVDGPWDAVKGVREQARRRADHIKFMATGGAMTRATGTNSDGMSREEMTAAIAEAHANGMPTSAHALGTSGIHNAIASGIGTVEHGVHLDEKGIAMMVERGTGLVSTLAVNHFLDRATPADGVPGHVLDKVRTLTAARSRSFQMAVAAGIKVAAGTDSGAPLIPHGCLVTELELMQNLGLTNYQAIMAGTRWAGELMGWGDRVGALAPGLYADILVAAGNPLEDLGVLKRPVAVFKDGALVAPVDQLDYLLRKEQL